VHVTLRSVCRSLRTQFVFPTVRAAIAAANRARPQCFRIAQFSVQSDHIHLIVEARDRAALVEGVRGLSIRIARQVNQLLTRRGRFIADRWHGRPLTSPRAVRNALVYVLANFKKHHKGCPAQLDVFSSALHFPDFIEFLSAAPIHADPGLFPRALGPPMAVILPATTWLLSVGWKRHGKLSIQEQPA
jgi:REP element-mobilizing transposase RayT